VVCLLPLGFGLRMGMGHGAEAACFESLLGVLACFCFCFCLCGLAPPPPLGLWVKSIYNTKLRTQKLSHKLHMSRYHRPASHRRDATACSPPVTTSRLFSLSSLLRVSSNFIEEVWLLSDANTDSPSLTIFLPLYSSCLPGLHFALT